MDRNKEKLNIGRFNELGKSLKEHFIKYEECKPLIKVLSRNSLYDYR